MHQQSLVVFAMAVFGFGCWNSHLGEISHPDSGAQEDAGTARKRHARFVGAWSVEQPFHALYETTIYNFSADGKVSILGSFPSNCSGHLSGVCETGHVSNCVRTPRQPVCESDVTCFFGDRWYSRDARTLVIDGDCSDDVAREIVIDFQPDASLNTIPGGSGGGLISVGGEAGWSHNSWEWSFRKCPVGASSLDDCL